MDRYRHEPKTLEFEGVIYNDEEAQAQTAESEIEGRAIFDSRQGNTSDTWIAFSRDTDTAQRIVDLLNASEARAQIEKIVSDDAEQQRVKKMIEARESLGSEIIEVIPGMTHYKGTAE